jgi:hypothetical protein
LPKDDSQHGRYHVHGEKVVSVFVRNQHMSWNCQYSALACEETDPSNDDCANMIPPKRCLVYFGECEAPALIRIRDVRIIIMEVVEGCVASSGPGCQVSITSSE